MAKMGSKMYIFSGYAVFPYTEESEFGWKWYTNLKNRETGKVTKMPFVSLKDARIWCRKNYMLGIVKGWIK